MNLIEQLGGYERAKNIHCGNAGDWGFYSVSCDWYSDKFYEGHGIVNIKDIEKELLKYRRQHNIFEVGDKVVIESYRNTYISCGRPSQYSIGDLIVIHNLDGNVISDDDYNFIDYRDVRHATDEEIKAGKRLEVDCEN